jgi:hypothetical protein
LGGWPPVHHLGATTTSVAQPPSPWFLFCGLLPSERVVPPPSSWPSPPLHALTTPPKPPFCSRALHLFPTLRAVPSPPRGFPLPNLTFSPPVTSSFFSMRPPPTLPYLHLHATPPPSTSHLPHDLQLRNPLPSAHTAHTLGPFSLLSSTAHSLPQHQCQHLLHTHGLGKATL